MPRRTYVLYSWQWARKVRGIGLGITRHGLVLKSSWRGLTRFTVFEISEDCPQHAARIHRRCHEQHCLEPPHVFQRGLSHTLEATKLSAQLFCATTHYLCLTETKSPFWAPQYGRQRCAFRNLPGISSIQLAASKVRMHQVRQGILLGHEEVQQICGSWAVLGQLLQHLDRCWKLWSTSLWFRTVVAEFEAKCCVKHQHISAPCISKSGGMITQSLSNCRCAGQASEKHSKTAGATSKKGRPTKSASERRASVSLAAEAIARRASHKPQAERDPSEACRLESRPLRAPAALDIC